MNLPYFAADTLGMTLYAQKAGLVANETHHIDFGEWSVELPIDVQSDLMSGGEIGLWVTLNHTLRLYLVVREKENWFYVLNTKKLETAYYGRTVTERVLELKPAIHAAFYWGGKDWSQSTV